MISFLIRTTTILMLPNVNGQFPNQDNDNPDAAECG
jgi:hypothetical protein